MTHSKNILTCAIAFCPTLQHFLGSYQQSGQYHPTTHDGFPKDKKVLDMDTESMFGRNFLVRPVTDSLYMARQKQNGHQKDMSKIGKTDVYLPQGARWIDFWTGQTLEGGQTLQREVLSIDIMPIYGRAGSILPGGPPCNTLRKKKWDNLTIRIYPGANAELLFYEDEFDNYNYEKGSLLHHHLEMERPRPYTDHRRPERQL